MAKVLLIVDAQNDFCEGGKLPVNGAKARMLNLAKYVEETNGKYETIILTADWHPSSHCSFTENGGTWPQHCVQYSEGAAIVKEVLDAANKCNMQILTKGNLENKEEYSIVDNALNGEFLVSTLSHKNIVSVDVCGIVSEICVLSTIKGLVEKGLKDKINVLIPYCAPLDADFENPNGKALIAYCKENGLSMIEE